MNFPQKYDLKVSTRFGKNYVTVEDAANVVYELEQTIQFLRLENNRLVYAVDKTEEIMRDRVNSETELKEYYKKSRDKAWGDLDKANIYKYKYSRAIAALCFTTTISGLLILRMFAGY